MLIRADGNPVSQSDRQCDAQAQAVLCWEEQGRGIFTGRGSTVGGSGVLLYTARRCFPAN